MPTIAGFNPIQSINSLIQPFGLAVSNKQQIINKIALATLAVIAFSYAPQAEGRRKDPLQECIESCYRTYNPMECQDRCHDRYGSY